MRIPPNSRPFGTSSPASGQLSSSFAQSLSGLPNTAPPSLVESLAALEQWRAQEEDTRRQTACWSLSQCPLTVWIEPYPESDAFQAVGSRDAVFMVMRQWEAASGGAISFRLLAGENPGEANILIRWDSQTTLGRDYEVGHTNRQVTGKRITEATITLITQPLIDQRLTPAQRQQRLATTILHETGHALGLEHSEEHRDVMYYRGWQNQALTENDQQRLRHLYGLGD